MQKPVGQWLQRAARLHRARMAEAVRDLGLFPGQEQALIALSSEGPMTVGQLATSLGVRPPTVSKMLHRLSSQALVARAGGKKAERKALLSLTTRGEEVAGLLEARMAGVEHDLVEALDGKDERRLRKLLKRVSQSLAPRAAAGEADDEDDDA